jgi:uncharacterized protein
VPDRKKSGVMSDAVIKASALYAFASAPAQKSFKFLWHAGEPLAAGIAFYRRAFAQISDVAPDGHHIVYAIQTNGTLINRDWCKLFSEYNVDVGLSIDGPASLHDSHRKTWRGRGSHERAMRGYRLLLEHGIYPGAICVLTKNSLSCPDAIYDFFVESGFTSIAFNVDETEGVNTNSSLAEAEAAYRFFMQRLWDRWREDDGKLYIREFRQTLNCIGGLKSDPGFVREPDEVLPMGIITIAKDGSISTFSPELASTESERYNNFVIGNVLRDAPLDVAGSVAFQKINSDVLVGRNNCKDQCAYYSLCGGGFQSNRIAEHESFEATETITCRLHRQILADVIIEKLSGETRQNASERAMISAG